MSTTSSLDGRYLFIWRHADAGTPLDDAEADFHRQLSGKGRKQAQAAARWLQAVAGPQLTLLSSPAPRAWQTASFAGPPSRLDDLAPGQPVAAARAALRACWPQPGGPVVLVGHQPQLGELISSLLGPQPFALTLRKAGIWALRYRAEREPAVVVVSVRDPAFTAARLSD